MASEYRKQPDTQLPGESSSATGEHPCGKCGGIGCVRPAHYVPGNASIDMPNWCECPKCKDGICDGPTRLDLNSGKTYCLHCGAEVEL